MGKSFCTVAKPLCTNEKTLVEQFLYYGDDFLYYGQGSHELACISMDSISNFNAVHIFTLTSVPKQGTEPYPAEGRGAQNRFLWKVGASSGRFTTIITQVVA